MANQEKGPSRSEFKKRALIAASIVGIIVLSYLGISLSNRNRETILSQNPPGSGDFDPTAEATTPQIKQALPPNVNQNQQVLFLERDTLPPAGTAFPFQGLLYLCQTVDQKGETVSRMFSGQIKPTSVFMIIHRARGTQTDDMVITRPTPRDFAQMDYDGYVEGCISNP